MKREFLLKIIVLFSLSSILMLCLGSGAYAQPRGRLQNIKIGFDRIFISGATYSLEDSSTSESLSNADQLVGNVIYGEVIFFDSLGLIAESTMVPLRREFELLSGSTVIGDVTESTTILMYGANFYFNRASGRGFKFYFGLATGTITADYSYSDASTGTGLAGASSTLAVPVNSIRLGIDWIMGKAGIRLQFQSLTGLTADTDDLSGFRQTSDYTASDLGIGVLAFF